MIDSAVSSAKVYGFNKAYSVNPDIFLETIFYPPKSKDVSIRNACSDQGVIYVGRLGSNGLVNDYVELAGGEDFQFDSPESLVSTMYDAIEAIPDRTTCLAYGSGGSNVGLWWNEDRFISDLRRQIAAEQPEIYACVAVN